MLDNGEVLSVCRAVIGFVVNLSGEGGLCGQTIWVAAVEKSKEAMRSASFFFLFFFFFNGGLRNDADHSMPSRCDKEKGLG